ncbi:MAG: DUF4476 domain-containing protein [Salinivirgaceae bacterium]|nr:DUF4476 domain-containing protein [Salinivirgaceae bacterium]MDY0282571.1 DUF4476 domain-containing protein [Salinivirgaceae bacterium]
MRKIQITISLLLITLVSMAQPAALNVFSEGELFQVSINGKKINSKPETSVMAFDITDENIQIFITLPNQNNLVIKQAIMVRPGQLMKTLVKQTGKGKWVARYQGEEPLPHKKEVVKEPMKSETLTINSTIAPANQLKVSTTTTSVPENQVQIITNINEKTGSVTATVNDENVGNNVSINTSFDGNNLNMTVTESTTTTITTTTTTTSTGGKTVDNAAVTINTTSPQTVIPVMDVSVVEPTKGCIPMNSADFSSAKNSIASKSFEDSKITTAKQIIKANCLKADQMMQIMKVMGFEASRLEIAKFAYQYCYDKNNYFKVNDAFEFEFSIDELNEYIEAQ